MIPPGEERTTAPDCPVGTVIGGGWDTKARVTQAVATVDRWSVTARNDSSAETRLVVVTRCLK
jgi:UTP:GlnB (protein PII) uridylyltransferase